jgi:hypothetical protein
MTSGQLLVAGLVCFATAYPAAWVLLLAPDDRPEPEDRAAEQPSPWDKEPAEERDRLAHVEWQPGSPDWWSA